MYEPCSLQKTSSALVASCLFRLHPSLSLQTIEVDSCGFDLRFFAGLELSLPLLQHLQEEVRRRASKASIRSYTMMPEVLQTYAKRENKHICGHFSDHQAIVDVLEIDSFCFILPSPHETEIIPGMEILLVGSASEKEGKGWLWHIRGVPFSNKTEAKKNRLVHETVWKNSAKDLLIKDESAVFRDDEMILLPRGVSLKREMVSKMTNEASQWIEMPYAESADSDKELVLKLLERRQEIASCHSFEGIIYEEVTTSRSPLYRLPLSFMKTEKTLVGYVFSKTEELPLKLFHEYQIPNRFSLLYSKADALEKINPLVSSFECQTKKYTGLGSKVVIFIEAKHRDGRWIPLSASLFEAQTKESLLIIPALSIERWMGFLREFVLNC